MGFLSLFYFIFQSDMIFYGYEKNNVYVIYLAGIYYKIYGRLYEF